LAEFVPFASKTTNFDSNKISNKKIKQYWKLLFNFIETWTDKDSFIIVNGASARKFILDLWGKTKKKNKFYLYEKERRFYILMNFFRGKGKYTLNKRKEIDGFFKVSSNKKKYKLIQS
jgi:hypothetical protein